MLDVFGSTEPVTRLLAADREDLLTKDKVEFRDVNENWDASYFCALPPFPFRAVSISY